MTVALRATPTEDPHRIERGGSFRTAARNTPAACTWLTKSIVAGTAIMLLTLMAWSLVLPLALGWHSTVVVSGSMEPSIMTGDVVVSKPVDPADVAPGQVLLFRDPANPGHLLMHRLVRLDGEGRFITRGDANLGNDSTPVPPANLVGLPVLRLPWIGAPALWAGALR